jgi:hypothetical protein
MAETILLVMKRTTYRKKPENKATLFHSGLGSLAFLSTGQYAVMDCL